MNHIRLNKILPNVFSGSSDTRSDIWEKDVYFEKGKSYLLKADSGRGKSSLCSYIYGYRSDYSGQIFFDNVNTQDSKANWDDIRSRHISLLFQELRLFPELTALENIQLKNNLTHYKTQDQIEHWLDILDIADRKDFPVGKMSWGQQQRVAIIRSLCQPFDFLFLDEPISHLDDKNAQIVAQLIEEEVANQGAGLLATSIGKDLPLNYTQIWML
ncbi:ATP-binding cassette domain-containing protein [Bacteroides sp. 224]|uniref:ATP-binding cassette domain-containing protein n=1 Tax=Bacteroides sp. 224 TaxID=2302936 RepID=UPI0013CFC7D7|nr:ATP-binding cassette domain-containing protein [Bacteroides sp. 224]NDV66303.1 ATP-binding cassette domain-containing protein [Bacteroides sp. 224]